MICQFWTNTTIAQTYIIEGKVTADDTEEPLMFANIYLTKSEIGIATDLEGIFRIELENLIADEVLQISTIGYVTQEIPLKDTSYQYIDLRLFSSNVNIEELVIYAGENPANAIVRNIIERKKINRLEGFDSYEVEEYNKLELDLYNFDTARFDSKALEPFKFILENMDSTTDEKTFLPGYMNENLLDIYYVNNKPQKEILKATKVSGIEGASAVKQLKRLTQRYNIYDNWIYVLEKNFASPFANSGLFFYEYYIIDSAYIQDQWSYKLKFKPRRKQENTFYGEFWVADTTFAIQQISMRKSPDVNINLVDRIVIYEEYNLANEGWLPEKRKILVDFLPTERLPGMIARKTMTYNDFDINNPTTNDNYKNVDPEDVNYNTINSYDSEFWEENRHDTLSSNESIIYQMVDSIQNTKRYETYNDLVYGISTGWIKVGKLEFGEYFNLFGVNAIEGNRLRLGLGTNLEFSTMYRPEVYVAYGTLDKEWKYGVEYQHNFKKTPRREHIKFNHFNDVVFTSRSSEEAIVASSASSFVRRATPQRILRVQETKLYYLKDFKRGVTGQATFLHRILDPYGAIYADGSGFNFQFVNPTTNEIDTTTTSTEFIFKLRHAHKEEFWNGHFDRVSMGSRYPIYSLQYTAGVRGVLGSQYNYHKIALEYRHWFYINPIGWTGYMIRAGKTLGTVPSLLLETSPGNETFIYSGDNFNLMNRYEFTSDTYISWRIAHHFDGLFFNKIPLLRKLEWRSLVHFRGVWGTLTEDNQNANRFNTADVGGTIPFRAPSPIPYMEVGVGIENIFKIFQIQATWRLNYLDNPESIPFIVQGGIYFAF